MDNQRNGIGNVKKYIMALILGGSGLIFADYALAEIDFGSVIKGDEPRLHVEKYGISEPIVVSNGYVFVDFKYSPAPYTIQRIGQAVVVNNIIVNCLYTNDIPKVFKRHVSEFVDDKGKKHLWKSPPHPAANLKNLGDLYVNVLCEILCSRSVFLSKLRYKSISKRSLTNAALQRCMPKIWQPDTVEFVKMLNIALEMKSNEESIVAFKEKHNVGKLEDKDVLLLIQNARKCPELLKRIQLENILSR